MVTILFFNQPEQGHINPTLPLVAELVRRGNRVIYYSLEDFKQAIERTGATFQSYQEAYPFDHTRADENGFKVFLQFLQVSQLVLERLLPQIAAEKPDVVIYDQLAMWGQYIAQILHVPAICSMPMFVLTPRLILTQPSMIFLRLRSLNVERQIHATAAKISDQYHVKKIGIFDIANNPGQLNIVYTSRAFQPYADSFDETYKFVGPSINPRIDAPVFPFDALVQGKPLLYISLGSIYNEHPEFYRLCFDTFADSNWQVVMSVGHNTLLGKLGAIPKNLLVQNEVPQLDILQRASLFISHGGMNSVSEALYHGVPLIIIPQAGDQTFVARRVEQLGAGKMLHRSKVHMHQLRHLVDDIIASSAFRKASDRIGATLRQAGGYIRAADEIEQFISNQSSKHVHEKC
jgi:MGT family glycosyltransferase